MKTLHTLRRVTSSRTSTKGYYRRPSRCLSTVLRTPGSPRVTEQSKFLDRFIETHAPPQESLAHFKSIPWTKRIFDMSTYEIIPFYSRYLDDKTGESRFFASTVNTPTTVPHALSFRRRDLYTPAPATQTPDSTSPIDLSVSSELLCLIHLGRDLEAHPGIVNGGFQSVIFDEAMYLLILMHQNNIDIPGPRVKHYTLSIDTKFLSPVRASSDVLVRASLVHRVGRKWFVRAEIVDCDGKLLTSADSWWLTAREPIS